MNRWHELATSYCLFLGNSAFEGRIGSEGPAGTTSSLIFDFTHMACSSMIDLHVDIDTLKSSSLEVISVIIENAISIFAFIGHFKSKKLLVLLRLEIRSPIVCEYKRVGIADLSSQLRVGVVLIDDIVVDVEPSLFLKEGSLIMYFLIVPGDEMEEGLILADGPSRHNTRANQS